MIWIVSKRVVKSTEELDSRLNYIKEITQTKVSNWQQSKCCISDGHKLPIEFYQCISKKGEYGVVITAHTNEVIPILKSVLTSKPAIIVINTCAISYSKQQRLLALISSKNSNSRLYFAKQEVHPLGNILINYVDNLGAFGFFTSQSERELFRSRRYGLIKAIDNSYCKVG